MRININQTNLTAILFILIAFGARIIPHPPNFTPLLAIALFAGATLSFWRSWMVVGLGMVLSNLVLGHDLVVWSTMLILLLITSAAAWLPPKLSGHQSALAATGGAVVFFIASNLAVWALGDWYPKTTAGLAECLILAVPFFPNTIISTLLYTLALFQGHRLLYPVMEKLRNLKLPALLP